MWAPLNLLHREDSCFYSYIRKAPALQTRVPYISICFRTPVLKLYNTFLNPVAEKPIHTNTSVKYVFNSPLRRLFHFIFTKRFTDCTSILCEGDTGNVTIYVDCTNRKKVTLTRPPLWSRGQSSRLQIQRSRVRLPALPDFLRSSGSGTRSTHPREDN
jgi:hypothetical protein